MAIFAHVARVVADAAGEPLVQFGLGLESVAGPEAADLKICCLVGQLGLVFVDVIDLLLLVEVRFVSYYYFGLSSCAVEQLFVALLPEEEAVAEAGLEQQGVLDGSLVDFDLDALDTMVEWVWVVENSQVLG